MNRSENGMGLEHTFVSLIRSVGRSQGDGRGGPWWSVGFYSETVEGGQHPSAPPRHSHSASKQAEPFFSGCPPSLCSPSDTPTFTFRFVYASSVFFPTKCIATFLFLFICYFHGTYRTYVVGIADTHIHIARAWPMWHVVHV